MAFRDVSLFFGGLGHYFGGEGHNLFPSCLGEGHDFFQGFLGEGHNFFKVFFIEKINYEYPAAAGAGFRFLLILPLPSKKKCPEGRNKTMYMNQFRRTVWHLEGVWRVKPIDESCYATVTYNVFITCNHSMYL